MSLLKPIVLGLGLVAAVALSAQAQTAASSTPTPGPSVASLPPEGPRPSSLGNIPKEPLLPITASGKYIGPAPGAGTGAMPPHFVKPAGWDQDTAMHPYSSGLGPKPN